MRTIVVLEDDDDTRAMLGDMLTTYGYQPLLLSDQVDAYPVIRRAQPALVILDLMSPFDAEAGWHLLNVLRSDPVTATIPAILYSANTPYLQSRRLVLEAKGAVVLEKPFHLRDLMDLVTRLIGE